MSYDFDLGLGIITLSFTETVDPSTLNAGAFRLQSSGAFPVDAQNLTGVVTNSSIGSEVVVYVQLEDLDIVKQTAGFGTARGNTFLAVAEGALADTAGNMLVEVSANEALQVTRFIPDVIRPSLLSFDLNMNSGILTLIFNDCLLYTSPSPRDATLSRMPSSA